MNSNKCPDVRSLKSASVEDYKFGKLKKIWGCGIKKEVRPLKTAAHLCYRPEDTLATNGTQHIRGRGALWLM